MLCDVYGHLLSFDEHDFLGSVRIMTVIIDRSPVLEIYSN